MNAARERPDRGAWVVAAVALVLRLGVAAWGATRFRPAGDGTYYEVLARRIAEGHGYTWLWPDGAVTSVAHYPVGYPAIVAAAYAVLGERPVAAMIVNAVFGAVAAYFAHRLVEPVSTRAARASGLVVALHPALLAYTPAIMTEGAATALLVVAAGVARRTEKAWLGWLGAGLALGVATLVRPQSILFAPLLGALAPVATATFWARARAAVVVTGVALAVCAPWTARNCVAMHQCALVSVNGGWNLLIGTQTEDGAWHAADVPDECRTVWDEAAKDACFGRAARRAIESAPLAWLARVPAKVAVTLDYFGAAPWYLHTSNPSVVDEHAKVGLGVVETVVSVLLLLAALGGSAVRVGPRRVARMVIAAAGVVVAAWTHHTSIAYGALVVVLCLLGPTALARGPLVVPWTAVVVAVTAATHAVFFGAGRYGLVVAPFVGALACAVCLRPSREDGTPAGPSSPRRSPVFNQRRRREESPSSTEHDAR